MKKLAKLSLNYLLMIIKYHQINTLSVLVHTGYCSFLNLFSAKKEIRRLNFPILRLRGSICHLRGYFFYECAENLLSFARLNCAVFNYFYR